MSDAFGLVYRCLFEVRLRDPSCGFLLVNRQGLQKILTGNIGILRQGFEWEFIARASAAELRIVETPVRHRQRASGLTQVYRPSKIPGIAVKHLLGLLRLKRELASRDRIRRPGRTDSTF
jgi:hypothetical protein